MPHRRIAARARPYKRVRRPRPWSRGAQKRGHRADTPFLTSLDVLCHGQKCFPSAQRHTHDEMAGVRLMMDVLPSICLSGSVQWLERAREGAREFLALGQPYIEEVAFLYFAHVCHRQRSGKIAMFVSDNLVSLFSVVLTTSFEIRSIGGLYVT